MDLELRRGIQPGDINCIWVVIEALCVDNIVQVREYERKNVGERRIESSLEKFRDLMWSRGGSACKEDREGAGREL